MANYPAKLDNTTTLPTAIDNITPVQGLYFNKLRDAVLSIETSLGINPAAVYSTVGARLNNIENILINNIQLNHDLGGTNINPVVVGIQGNPIANNNPTQSQVLQWNGLAWIPTTISSDLSITLSSATVIKIQNRNISPNTPFNGQSLTWVSANNDWEPVFPNAVALQGVSVANTSPVQSAVPVYDVSSVKYNIRQLTLDDVLPAYAISSFTGGSIVEVGASVTNPVFVASYTATPASANITNTDAINSPLVLVTPFTNGTVVGTFTHSTISSVIFTLTAISTTSITKTATQSIAFQARSFGGVGSAGATSATASSNNAILVGATGTLSNEGLHSSDVGQSYGIFNPSNQKIYLLLPHTSTPHTFLDQSGFSFPMTLASPTIFNFTNQNGSVISMDLYESANLLSTSFTITVKT